MNNDPYEQLTPREYERQDAVDAEICDLLNKLAPEGTELEWNIEDIGKVRDAVFEVLHDVTGMTEMEFYPYILLPASGGKPR